jgi:hypothetical protein
MEGLGRILALAPSFALMGRANALSQPRATGIDSFFVSARRVVLLLVLQLVEQDAVYSHRVDLWNSPAPDTREGLVQCLFRPASHDFVNEGNVLAFGEDEAELFFTRSKDVVDRVGRAVDDLDVFHAL